MAFEQTSAFLCMLDSKIVVMTKFSLARTLTIPKDDINNTNKIRKNN